MISASDKSLTIYITLKDNSNFMLCSYKMAIIVKFININFPLAFIKKTYMSWLPIYILLLLLLLLLLSIYLSSIFVKET